MTYYLYILMRNDMESLNPGKAMAQAAHAANQFVQEMSNSKKEDDIDTLVDWESDGKGFGTTIVLEGNILEIQDAIELAKSVGIVADMVMDETYPVEDGMVTHLLPVETCGYIFAMDDDHLKEVILSEFDLHE